MIHEHDKLSSMLIDLNPSIPISLFSFRFDHLRREASEPHPHSPDEHAEPWRLAIEKELTEYIKDRYTYGASTVIGASDADTITIAAFIESHKYEPKNFWYEEMRRFSDNCVIFLGMDAGVQNGH